MTPQIVYVVWHNAPDDFGEENPIVSVHATMSGAKLKITKLQQDNSYLNQYLECNQFEVKE